MNTFFQKMIMQMGRIGLPLLIFLGTGRLVAQPEGGGEMDVNIDVEGGNVWYAQWWIWALGIAIFIIILVAIVSAGRRTT